MIADRRGVSEVVGFVLIFSLITTTVGVVYVTGFSGLENLRNSEQLENAERAFDVLADNIDDQHAEGAPNRATEIKLNDAGLRFGEDVKFELEVSNNATPQTVSVRSTPIVYESQRGPSGTRVLYSGGAVFRAQDRGADLRETPPITTRRDGDRRVAIISVIETRPTGQASIAGSSNVLVRTQLALRDVVYASPPPRQSDSSTGATTDADAAIGGTIAGSDPGFEYDVTYRIETTPERARAWEPYLEARISWRDDACSIASPGVLECRFPAERIIYTATRLDTSLDR